MAKDFVGFLPEEVSLNIFQYGGQRDKYNAASVSHAWYDVAERVLVESRHYSHSEAGNFQAYLDSCKKIAKQTGRLHVYNLAFNCKFKNGLDNWRSILASGIESTWLSVQDCTPDDVAMVDKDYHDQLVSFSRVPRSVTFTFSGPGDLSGLDTVLCNAKSVSLQFPGFDNWGSQNRTPARTLSPLERLRIWMLDSQAYQDNMYFAGPLAYPFEIILSRYDMPALKEIEVNMPLEKTTLERIIQKRLAKVRIDRGFISLHWFFNLLSVKGVSLEELYFRMEDATSASSDLDMAKTDLNCLCKLKYLELERVELYAPGLLKIVKATNNNLTRLKITGASYCDWDRESEAYFEQLLQFCPKLERLRINECGYFTDSALVKLGNAFRTFPDLPLNALDISDNPATSAGLISMIIGFPYKLGTIDIGVLGSDYNIREYAQRVALHVKYKEDPRIARMNAYRTPEEELYDQELGMDIYM